MDSSNSTALQDRNLNQTAINGNAARENSSSLLSQNILTLYPQIMRDVSKTVIFTPDKLWRDLGLCERCPTWQQVMSYANQEAWLDTLGGGTKFDSFTGTTQYNNNLSQIRLTPFYKYRSDEEQQMVLKWKSTQDQLNPARVWRDAAQNTEQSIASIFAHFSLDPLVTTYNIAPYVIALGDYDGATAPPIATWQDIGLMTLATEISQGRNWLETMYPVLWDKVNANDYPCIGNIARWTSSNLGLELLIVYTTVNSVNAPLTPHAAQAVGAMTIDMLQRMGNLLTEEDNKMMLCLQWLTWATWDGTTNGAPAVKQMHRQLPTYNFANHLVAYLAYYRLKHEVDFLLPFHNMRNAVGDNLSYLMFAISHLIYDRKLDFFHRSRHWPGYTPIELLLYDPFTTGFDAGYTHQPMDLFVRYHVPAAAVIFFTGKARLAPMYEASENLGTPRGTTWRRFVMYDRQVVQACDYEITDTNQPYFQPMYLYTSNTPWNTAAQAPYNYPTLPVGSRPGSTFVFGPMFAVIRSSAGNYWIVSAMDFLGPPFEQAGISKATQRLIKEHFVALYNLNSILINHSEPTTDDGHGGELLSADFSFLGQSGDPLHLKPTW